MGLLVNDLILDQTADTSSSVCTAFLLHLLFFLLDLSDFLNPIPSNLSLEVILIIISKHQFNTNIAKKPQTKNQTQNKTNQTNKPKLISKA